MANPEHLKDSGERLIDVQEASEQAAERLKDNLEKAPSVDNKQERLSSARRETEAAFAKESGSERKTKTDSSFSSPRFVSRATKRQKDEQYKQTLRQTQSQLSLPSRTFSKFIHLPAVEKASDAIGATVARPNAILMGGLTSLIIVSAVYLIAKHYGYSLSGGETIVAFGLGWVLGLILDYAQLIFRSRR